MSGWKRWASVHGVNVTLIALAAAATLGVLWDRQRISTDEAEGRKYMLIDAWRPDDLSELALTHGDESFTLRSMRDDDGAKVWRMTVGGRDVEVDELAVNELLTALELTLYERRVEGLDAAATGLDQPVMQYRLSMGALSYTVAIGGEAPKPAGGRYVSVSGGARPDTVYVIEGGVADELVVSAKELRARELVSVLSQDVDRYELDGASGWTLKRGGWGGRTAGAFMLVTDAGAVRADRDGVNQLLLDIRALAVHSFVPVPPAPDENEPSVRRLTVAPRNGAPIVLELGGPCPAPDADTEETERLALAVRRGEDPVAGCVPREQIDAVVATDPTGLVDTHVIGTAPSDVVEIQVRGDDGLEIARREAGWTMRIPEGGEVDTAAANQLLDDMTEVRGELLPPGETDLAALGLTAPRNVHLFGLPERLVSEAAEREERIAVGAPVEDGWIYVRRRDDDRILRIDAASARLLVPEPAQLRAAQIYADPIHAVSGLTLDCDGRRQVLARDVQGAWTLSEPKDVGLGAGMTLASEMTERMRQLTAVRWVAERPTEDMGLGEPWCRIELRLGHFDDVEKRVVVLGAATPGGYYAQHDGRPAVFVAPRAVGSWASRWFLDTNALILDTRVVTSVALTLAGGERTLAIDASSSQWVAKPGGSRLGAELRDAVERMIAEGVVHLGAPRERDGFDEPLLTITAERRGGEPVTLRIGRGDVWAGTNVYMVRRSDIDATFAVSQARLRPLMDW